MLFSSRRSGSWPWALLGVGACLLAIVAPMCAQDDVVPLTHRSVVFVVDLSERPPSVADGQNQVPGTYDVYDSDGEKTELVLVLSGDTSAVDWTLKGTPYSGRLKNPSASGSVSADWAWGGDFPVPGKGFPGVAAMWVKEDENAHYRASQLKLRNVKGGGWTWQYRLQKREEPDGQDAAGTLSEIWLPMDRWLPECISRLEDANRNLGAEFEWAIISYGDHSAFLEQRFTDAIDESAYAPRRFRSRGDRPLVWAITQALGYLYQHGRHPNGQIIVISDGMDLCDDRSPNGGRWAVARLNRALGNLKLPGRSPATTGGTRRSQRFGTVDLFPIDLGLLRQGRPGEALGAAGETIDDMLPRVQALIEGSDKQVTVSVVTTDPTLSEQDAAALRSIAEAGGGSYSSAATPDGIADAVSQVIGLADPDAGDTPPDGIPDVTLHVIDSTDPDTPEEWATHKDDAQGITMQIAPGWEVGKGMDEIMLELRGPTVGEEKHEGALVCLDTDEGGTLDEFIAQAGQWANDQVGRECGMRRGATLQCPEGDVATLRFTDPESPQSYLLAFVTLGKHNGYILGFQGPQADEESVRADLEKMAESMQVP